MADNMEAEKFSGEQNFNQAVQEIELHVQQFDYQDALNFASATPGDDRCRSFIIDVSKLLSKCYDDLVNRFDDIQLSSFQYKVSQLPYSRNTAILNDISAWSIKRKELIGTLNLSADQLDQSYSTATIGRLVGSTIDLLHDIDSVLENQISKSLTEQAFDISPTFGIASQIFFKCAPHLAYLGLVSSLGDVMYSKLKMRSVLKVIKEDLEMFEKIKPWIEETKKLDAEAKKLFPFGLDKDIVADVEKAFNGSDCCMKVFAAAVFSNLRKYPLLYKNTKFLSEVFIFSRSEAAEEWYSRTLKVDHPIGFEIRKLDIRRELADIVKFAPEFQIDIARLAPEVAVHLSSTDEGTTATKLVNVKMKAVPIVVQGVINCFSIYFSYRELMDGATHKISNALREMSNGAKDCLNKINALQREQNGAT